MVQGEQCDDGDIDDLDGCDSSCIQEIGWTFSNETNPETGFAWTVTSPMCGDSRVVSAEHCDEGPDSIGSGIGCADDCLSPE